MEIPGPQIGLNETTIRVEDRTILIPIASKMLLIGALFWMVTHTARLPETKRLPARLILIYLLINLFGPLGWVHYYLPQLILLSALIGLLPKPRGALVFGGVALLTSWPLLMALRLKIPGDFLIAAIGTTTMILLFVALTLWTTHRSTTQT